MGNCNHLWKWERELCSREAGQFERPDMILKGKRLITTDIMKCRRCGELTIDGPVPEDLKAKAEYLTTRQPAKEEGA